MKQEFTETHTTEKPTDAVALGKEVVTETITKSTDAEVVGGVPEKQPDGSTVVKDAPTEGGTRFK